MTPPDGLRVASEELFLLIRLMWKRVKTLAPVSIQSLLMNLCAIFSLCITLSPIPTLSASTLSRELDNVEAEHAGLCFLPAHPTTLTAIVQGWASELRSKLPQGVGPDASVEILSRFIFQELAIKPSQDLHDPCNLVPSAILVRKQGYCVGLAAIYLALAQELDVPIFAVSTPSHVFLRYDDGTTRINIETTALGAPRTDESYIREGKIPAVSVRKGVFLRNLSTEKFLAQVHNNLGVIDSEQKNYAAAAREYETALDLDCYLPEAWYNWGNDLLRSGEYRGAVKMFTRSLRLYPDDVWALNNRGVALKKLEKMARARRDFEQALRIDAGFGPAKGNLADLER